MDKKLNGILQILFSILIVVVVFIMSDHIDALKEYGYIGVFVISILSSATLFFPAPSWAAVLGMSAVLNPYLLGIAAGVGSGLGETTGYIAGRGARTLTNTDTKWFKKSKELIKKYEMPAIFLLAFIPNPVFDVAGLIAGAMKLPYWKYVLPCILGRTIRYILLAYLGAFTIGLIS